MDAIDVSVLLLAGRDRDVLHNALAHLEQQSYPAARFEIIVADQGLNRDISEMLPRRINGSPARIRVIPVPTSSSTIARNNLLAAALGRWVIFLDTELLAGPRLVEQHVKAQDEHGSDCVVVGKIDRHPQSSDTKNVRHEGFLAAGQFVHGQPLRFLDWRFWNLSVPRQVIDQAGGLDESFVLTGLCDIELAWRLEQGGLHGFYSEEAAAYAWMQMPAGEELVRRYSDGYTLWHVLGKTRSEMLANRYLGRRGGYAWMAVDWLIAPVCSRLCGLPRERNLPVTWMCRKLSRYAVLQGYNDARRSRPPRFRPQS